MYGGMGMMGGSPYGGAYGRGGYGQNMINNH